MSLSCVTILGCTTILFRVQLPKYALMQWRVCVEVPLNLLSNQTSGASSSLSVTTLPNLWMDTSSIAFTLTFFRMFLVHHIKFVYIFICIVHYLSSLYIFLCISLTWVCQDALTLSLLLLFRSRIANSIKVENLQREWACEHLCSLLVKFCVCHGMRAYSCPNFETGASASFIEHMLSNILYWDAWQMSSVVSVFIRVQTFIF